TNSTPTSLSKRNYNEFWPCRESNFPTLRMSSLSRKGHTGCAKPPTTASCFQFTRLRLGYTLVITDLDPRKDLGLQPMTRIGPTRRLSARRTTRGQQSELADPARKAKPRT
ncbi:hypothetical protein J1N35_015082, partial [Gossypium stocksii]